MQKIKIKSPTRVDLAGGTLDLWPLYNFVEEAKTVNVAIDIYTEVEIEVHQGPQIQLVSEDLNSKKEYANFEECLKDKNSSLALLQRQVSFWKPNVGFKLTTRSGSPVGGGLGGSSSLIISLLKAFAQLNEYRFSDSHQCVHWAHNIESQVLNTPTGTQDYYPAYSGGLNILNYNQKEITQRVLPIVGSELEKCFMLVYTGKAHHSGLNNFEVLKNAIGKNHETMDALFKLKEIASETAVVCEKNQWHKIPELFQKEYAQRIRLAPAFSSPEIEKLKDLSLKAGAEAVKICGAGGGGCVLLWVPTEKRERVAEQCQKNGFQVLSARPVQPLT